MTSPQLFELTYIECSSGLGALSEKPFVEVRVLTKEGHSVMGSVDVATARQLGMQFLTVAEAALSDAAVYKVLTKDVGAPPDTALGLISSLRANREDKDDGDGSPDAH